MSKNKGHLPLWVSLLKKPGCTLFYKHPGAHCFNEPEPFLFGTRLAGQLYGTTTPGLSKLRPTIQLALALVNFWKCSCISFVCIYCHFLQTLKKCLIIKSTKHSITATIEDNVSDITCAGKLETHTVLTYHCTASSVWPGPLRIVPYLPITAKTLDNPALH